jgi:hypothetical protein
LTKPILLLLKEETTTSGKLWARIIHATVSNNTIEYHDNCAGNSIKIE